MIKNQERQRLLSGRAVVQQFPGSKTMPCKTRTHERKREVGLNTISLKFTNPRSHLRISPPPLPFYSPSSNIMRIILGVALISVPIGRTKLTHRVSGVAV